MWILTMYVEILIPNYPHQIRSTGGSKTRGKQLKTNRKREKYKRDLQGSEYRLTNVILSC